MINSRKQAGFSMMELLVAVLVMGVGVLGVTGLQLISLQNNQDALLRSEAVMLAYDMIDRVRANVPVDVAGGVMTETKLYADVAKDADPPAVGANDCMTADCTPAAMVNFDLAYWKCSLGAHNEHAVCEALREADRLPAVEAQPGLPAGRGVVEIDGDMVIVTVEWEGFNNEIQTVTVRSKVYTG